MSELPPGVARATPPQPHDSASGIAVRAAGDGWAVLVGRRTRAARFMPGQLAFPGGRLEPVDRPAEPGAAARSVAREFAEETGIDLPPAAWLAAGWRITPPIYPARFHNRFFVAALPAGVEAPAPATAEHEWLRVVPAGTLVADWERGAAAVPPPLLPILRVVATTAPGALDALARAVAAANREEERAPRIEFFPGVWLVPLSTATLPPATHTNVWLAGGRRFVVVDPGSDEPDEIERLAAVVERRRGQGDVAAAILLTHHHRDHTAGAVAAAERLGLPVLAHRSVLDALGPPRSIVCEAWQDGTRLDLDGMTLRAHATPGHAPGHLAFELVEPRLVVSGDLASGLSTILVDPDGGDMGDYFASLERVRALEPRALLPGHGAPLGRGELDRLIAHRREREARVAAALAAEARPLAAIAREAYADLPELPLALIERQTLSHLLLLERLGTARRRAEDWAAGGARA